MTAAIKSKCLGVILAGGSSTRMGGGDKFTLPWGDQTLIEHCIARAQPQVDQLVISANGDLQRLAHLGLPVLTDLLGAGNGPLAGVVTAMAWARQSQTHYDWLATFASDTPLFPRECVPAMKTIAEQKQRQVVYARSGQRPHYTFALWSLSTLDQLLEQYEAGERALKRAIASFSNDTWEYEDEGDSFFNVNTPADLRELHHKRRL